MRREGGEEGREALYLVCLEPNTQERERERERDEQCFTEESKGGRAGLIRAHAHAMSKFVFLCPLFFCFLTSRLLTYALLQDDCPSIYNANVAQDSKPWADDRAPNAIFACFVS